MHYVTRRAFLAGCGSTAVTAWAIDAATRTAYSESVKELSLSELTLETFEPLVGQTFLVDHGGDAPIPLRLQEAVELDSRFQRDQAGKQILTGFRLLFEGPPDKPLEQGIYNLRSDSIAAAGVFMTPVTAASPAHREYEAIFTRMIEQPRLGA